MSNDKGLINFWKERISINVARKSIEGAQVGQRVLYQCCGMDVHFHIDGKKYTYEDQKKYLISEGGNIGKNVDNLSDV